MDSQAADNTGVDPPSSDAASSPVPQPFARLVIRGADGPSVTKDILRPTTLVGAVGPCNIELVGPGIGPVHCVFAVEGGGLRVHDLRSASGTWVNGERIEVAPLASGDVVRVGEFECRVETNLPRVADSTAFGNHARLLIAGGDGREIAKDIFRATTLGGSRPGCNIQFGGADVSPAHFVITVFGGRLRIRDLRTRFPTRVNGRAITAWTLADGDEIAVGPFHARIETSLPGLADDPENQLDGRFAPSPVAAAQETARQEQSRLEQERAELATARESIAAERAEVARLRAELEKQRTSHREEVARHREDQAARRQEADALAVATRELEQARSELAAQRAALAADRSGHQSAI